MRAGRWMLLLNHAAAVFLFGWLSAIRRTTGDLVLLDELIAIAPPLIGVLGLWWLYYPIERRVRDAIVIRRLDLGQPVYPTPSRAGFVLLQARVNLLLMLVPVLLIVGVVELIGRASQMAGDQEWSGWMADAGTVAAAFLVFVLAPVVMRFILDVEPLGAGPLREQLLSVCRRHKVRVRQLLVWHTHGMMINAAVMGLLGRLRYVLLTDALLESMTQHQVRAVMAHEVAHVRRHHIPWLAVALMATVSGGMLLIEAPFYVFYLAGAGWVGEAAGWIELGTATAGLLVALLLFGWICRRFERQADTFAIQDLSACEDALVDGRGEVIVSAEAVDAMTGALGTIARLNAIDADRPSWRHGSIAWRQEYLRTLVGRAIDRLPIDRQVRRIKLSTALALIVVMAAALGLEAMAQRRSSSPADGPPAEAMMVPPATASG